MAGRQGQEGKKLIQLTISHRHETVQVTAENLESIPFTAEALEC